MKIKIVSTILMAIIFFNAKSQISTTTLAGDYKVINIGDNTYGDYTHSLILLHEIYNGTLINHNYAIGTITAMRGSANSGNLLNMVNVTTSSAYNGISGTITSNDDNATWALKTCIYNGKRYLAVDIPYNPAYHNLGYYFNGWTFSTGENMKCVPYLVNGAPVNTTLVSDIQDFSSNMIETHNVAGLNITGNVGIGTASPIGNLDVRGASFVGTPDFAIGSAGSMVQIDQGANSGNTYSRIRAFSNGGTAVNNLVLQSSGGNVGIGTTSPSAKMHIFNSYDLSNTTGFKMFYQGTWGTASYASDFRFIDVSSTEGGKVLEANGYGIGIGFDPPAYASADKLYVNGNVGIGTTSPGAKLDVNGDIGIMTSGKLTLGSDLTHPSYIKPVWNDNNNTGLQFHTFAGSVDVAAMTLSQTNGNVGIGTTSPSAKMHIFNSYDLSNTTGFKMFYQGTWGTASYASDFRFIDVSSTEGGKVLEANGYGIGIGFDPPAYASADKLYVNGNVAIGTTDPKGYKLAVAGNAIAESMTVRLQANWPDYVFKIGHNLMPLADVKTYIDKNQHLPEIPSAAEVEKDGQNLGEMNKLLLKKVEELTLYLIQQKQEMEKQKESQQQQIDELKQQITNIKLAQQQKSTKTQ